MNPDTLETLRNFLEFGAIGIAGLMLVLVVITILATKFTPQKLELMKRFMFLGAFCFFVATAAQVYLETRPQVDPADSYTVTLEVVPHDFGSFDLFPPPIIRMGGTQVDRSEPITIAANTTLIVDLLDGVDIFQQKEEEAASATEQVAVARSIIEEQNASLTEAQEVTKQVVAEITEIRDSAGPEEQGKIEGITRGLTILEEDIERSIQTLD